LEDWNEKDESSQLAKVGRYELKSLLGKGASGLAYLAFDPHSRKDVTIKLLKANQALGPHWEDLNLRFRKIAAGLSHPNLPAVLDFGLDANRPFIVTEFVEGLSLDRLLEKRELPTHSIILKFLKEFAELLDYVHSHNIVHADLKPANIVLSPSYRPYLLDLPGTLIKTAASEICEEFSADSILGTPAYLAPEQLLHRKSSNRTDLFSFAVICFECLTYKLPFKGKSFAEITRSILEIPPTSAASYSKELSDALDPIFSKALSKDSRDRYDSAQKFIEELARSINTNDRHLRQVARTELVDSSKLFNSEQFPGQSKNVNYKPTSPGQGTFSGSRAAATVLKSKVIEGVNLRLLALVVLLPLIVFILFIISPRKTLLVLDTDPDLSILNELDSNLVDPARSERADFQNSDTLHSGAVSPDQSAIGADLIQKIMKVDKNEPTLSALIDKLVEHSNSVALKNYPDLFSHPSYLVRVTAIKLVIQNKDKTYITNLKKAFDDPDPLVRGFAVKALGLIGEPNDKKYIELKLQNEKQTEVKMAMQKAILRLNELEL
jgi:serine/threonine protein kinase